MIDALFDLINQKYKLNEFSEIVNCFENLVTNAVQSKKIKDEQNFLNILIHTAGNVIVRSREIILLCHHGYADGALALARSLYEHFIILSFFCLHENDKNFQDYIDDFFFDYERLCNKQFLNMSKKINHTDLQVKIENEMEQLKNKVHHKIIGDYWWAGFKTFSELINHVEKAYSTSKEKSIFYSTYDSYQRACASIHPSCFGIFWRLEAKNQYTGINTAPSAEGHELPLQLSSLCLIKIFGVILSHIDVDYTDILQILNCLAFEYCKLDNEKG